MRVRAGALVLVVLPAVLLATGRDAVAANPTGEEPQAASGAQGTSAGTREGKWVLGEIIKVTGHTVSISQKDRMLNLEVTHDTDIMVDGRRASLNDLKPGAPVLAAYEGARAYAKAVRIDVDEATGARLRPSSPGAPEQ